MYGDDTKNKEYSVIGEELKELGWIKLDLVEVVIQKAGRIIDTCTENCFECSLKVFAPSHRCYEVPAVIRALKEHKI